MLPIPAVPEELSARVPAEQRGPGLGRDAVRLLVSRGTEVSHHRFDALPELLRAGDVLVVNTSRTLPAAVDGTLGGDPVVVHFSTRGDDGRWAVELRAPDGAGTTRPRPGGPAGAEVRLPAGARLVLEEPLAPGADRLWWARAAGTWPGAPDGRGGADAGAGADGRGGAGAWGDAGAGGGRYGSGAGGAEVQDGGAAGAYNSGTGAGVPVTGVPALLDRYGRPIRYRYTERDQPLSAYQTVFALPVADGAGSAEMPSAARPFTAELVARLVSRGVQVAPLVLHTGVASAEAHEPPYPERFAVPGATARLVNAARAGGGRVIPVGTTAVRALESAAGPDGVARPAEGWTDLVVTPERGVRVVDGLLTGLHEPAASHLLMLEAVAGRAAVVRGYTEALDRLYLWHEFGDVHLLLKKEERYSAHCSRNGW
ncbi:S-adenosylmethionine:tRNA ribosyltransferase-isomerase [Streptomyces sp. NRRL S-87]|uniref:S-adenosylmethionine:tRNA ribosyltransferase-isomerase n=1 Tax=Streptomyces sp. NRRL S-87 TaxID=1463920 RepID=UPI0007C59C80|nr:S-adenosylmethionine:tRNA ribosyltransferase-isomerase [Streptomyces sp. NRRL S-87]